VLKPPELFGSFAASLKEVSAAQAYGSPLVSEKVSRDSRRDLVRALTAARLKKVSSAGEVGAAAEATAQTQATELKHLADMMAQGKRAAIDFKWESQVERPPLPTLLCSFSFVAATPILLVLPLYTTDLSNLRICLFTAPPSLAQPTPAWASATFESAPASTQQEEPTASPRKAPSEEPLVFTLSPRIQHTQQVYKN
jgi:hypothetical protein